MSKNKSINSEKTSNALNYFYRLAKSNGKLEDILNLGGFSEEAIKAAIRRGRISKGMILAFNTIMGTSEAVLIGEEELNDYTKVDFIKEKTGEQEVIEEAIQILIKGMKSEDENIRINSAKAILEYYKNM